MYVSQYHCDVTYLCQLHVHVDDACEFLARPHPIVLVRGMFYD